MSNKYILTSLESEESKKIAEIISNKTCRKILELLSEKDKLAESQIAKKLNLGLPTVHYNLQNMVKTNLIKKSDFAYSDKGKKVNLYSLANKWIIIAPKGSEWKDQLKSFIPVVGITVLISGLIYSKIAIVYYKPIDTLQIAKAGVEMSDSVVISCIPGNASYFLVGALVALVLYLLINLWRKRK